MEGGCAWQRGRGWIDRGRGVDLDRDRAGAGLGRDDDFDVRERWISSWLEMTAALQIDIAAGAVIAGDSREACERIVGRRAPPSCVALVRAHPDERAATDRCCEEQESEDEPTAARPIRPLAG